MDNSPLSSTPGALHRSGAVARMLRMPVATLRVWERRYQLTQPATSPSGQRLYTAADIQRLALIKRLCDLGHAIGSLAALDMAQLHSVAATHAQALRETQEARTAKAAEPEAARWRVAVIGAALDRRLRRAEVQRQIGRPLTLLGPFEHLDEAQAALRHQAVDLLLHQQARLHAQSAPPTAPEASAWQQHALLYRYASESSCERWAQAGVLLMQEPQSEVALGQWLKGLLQASRPTQAAPALSPASQGDSPGSPSARRWDDAALADFASLSSTVACECPRHVAELLMQLSHFEAYSAECQSLSPADAVLHAQLRQVAGRARAQFEAALELIAAHEGLVLPSAAHHPPPLED